MCGGRPRIRELSVWTFAGFDSSGLLISRGGTILILSLLLLLLLVVVVVVVVCYCYYYYYHYYYYHYYVIIIIIKLERSLHFEGWSSWVQWGIPPRDLESATLSLQILGFAD